MGLRRWATIVASRLGAKGDGVELAADGTPKAFRIWTFGENPTDHGVHTFSKESARLLAREQELRGNLYSIDVDHLSLSEGAPPESRKAVGWHRLEVRADGLWAVDVQWTDAVRAGLTKDPPEWRYFSPAYDTKKSGEVVSYVNTALTNNPATWSVTAIAARTSSKETVMDPMKDALAAMAGDDDEKKAEARAWLKKAAADEKSEHCSRAKAALAAFGEPDGDEGKGGAGDGDGDEKKAEKKAAEGEPDEAAKKAAADDAEKKATAQAATRAKDAEALKLLGEQDERLKALEAEHERTERSRIMATRADLTASQVKFLASRKVGELEELLALIPKPVADPAAAARVQGTRGDHDDAHSYGSQRASRLPAQERQELAERMGADPPSQGIHWERSSLVFPSMNRQEARRILAAREKAKNTAAGSAAAGGAR